MPSLEVKNNIETSREIIEIEDDHESDSDSDSDSESSQEDGRISVGVENWVRNTQAHQAPLQYYDIETSKWMDKDHDLSDDFLADLRDIVCSSGTNPKIDRGLFDMDISRSTHQKREMVNDSGFGGFEVDTNSMTEDPVALPAGNYPEDFRNLDKLCIDVMNMHRDEQNTPVRARRHLDTEYEFCWTGM